MPRPYRYLSDMPDKARAALERCHTTVVLVAELEQQKIHKVTIVALESRGLIEEGRTKGRKAYKPTAAGLVLLLADEPRLLGRNSGYVRPAELGERDRSMFGEPEAVDEQTQRYQTADAHDRMQGLPGRRRDLLEREVVQLTRRLKQEARRCDPASTDVAVTLERIRTEIDRLEGLRAA